MSEDESSPTLPKPDGRHENLGRPSKAELEDMSGDLVDRAAALDAREAEIADREAAATAGLPSRVSADEVGAKKDGADSKSQRKQLGQQIRLDATKYIEMHQDMQLMWVNELNGDVQRWIDAGAEPVPVQSKNSREFKGITDRTESQWVRSIGGDDGMGGHFWVYLLMIDPDVYEELVIAPERERQALIRRAMAIGKDQSEYGEGPKLPSYAPNLPTGERGFDEQHEIVP